MSQFWVAAAVIGTLMFALQVWRRSPVDVWGTRHLTPRAVLTSVPATAITIVIVGFAAVSVLIVFAVVAFLIIGAVAKVAGNL